MHHGTEIDFVAFSLAESCFYRKILSTETVVFLVSFPASVFLLLYESEFLRRSSCHYIVIICLNLRFLTAELRLETTSGKTNLQTQSLDVNSHYENSPQSQSGRFRNLKSAEFSISTQD